MNIVDFLIVVGVVLSLIRGHEVGFVRQFFSTAGFFLGLYLGVLLQKETVHLATTPAAKAVVTIATTIGCALVVMAIGEYIGMRLKQKIVAGKFNRPDMYLGSVLAGLSLLLIAWLSASILTAYPSAQLQTAFQQSRIISALDNRLPPAPAVIASLSRLIDPNGFPQVFTGREPTPHYISVSPSLKGFTPAINSVKKSIVKIEGQGCGGVVEGTGFVVGDGLVATNAHVVAGISAPYVSDNSGTHRASAIWFDPDLDFAILRTSGLAGDPLQFDETTQPDGTKTAILGYPGGGALDVEAGVILDQFDATGRNIYGQGSTTRAIYELNAHIIPGNSGGPIITKDGAVAGVVFAESTSYKNVGYALTAKKVASEVRAATLRNETVSTDRCAE